jgi:colanic acid/amylovoran biosynthesis glycosyltransferase
LKVAYLVNQYPKVSHSFIRREILGVEAYGIEVARFAIRSCREELVDEADHQELQKTRIVLDAGAFNLLRHFVGVALRRPGRFGRSLKAAIRLGRRSDRGLLLHLVYLAEACVLLDWFRADQIDHVHAHFGTNSTTVALLCQSLGGPAYSFTAHGPEEFDKVEALALPEKIRRAAFVVAISSFGKSQLYRWCDAKQWSKIQVVHCGLDESFLGYSPSPVPDVPNLICVGRLSEQKGQFLLLDAVAQLAAAGVVFQLTLVGDGPLRPDIEAFIAQHGLHNTVKLVGWASNATVRQMVLDSRALVLPSFAEGLPVVLMEALALHRPVITTYVAGVPELVTPGCGWLITPGSVESLVEALHQVLTTPVAELGQMGHTGAARVLAQHDIATEARKLAHFFTAASTGVQTIPMLGTPESGAPESGTPESGTPETVTAPPSAPLASPNSFMR